MENAKGKLLNETELGKKCARRLDGNQENQSDRDQ